MKLLRLLTAAAGFLALAMTAGAQEDALYREVISREYSVDNGGLETDPAREAVSRELTIRIENGPSDEYGEVISREMDLLVSRTTPPAAVSPVAVTVTPTGETATLDWSGYNQWAEADITRFDIYLSDAGPFPDVTGRTPFLSVSGTRTSVTLTGLAGFTDHYFAVVAVNGQGEFLPAVSYSAAYILSPETLSRELTLFIGEEPAPPGREAISREYDLAVDRPGAPPAVAGLSVTVSPTGEQAVLDWSGYNQWEVGDVARFDIFLSDSGGIPDVTGLTPFASVSGGGTTITLTGLTAGTDHFFAVVPVDALGNRTTAVNYAAAYVLSPEIISRELTLLNGEEFPDGTREAVSREYAIAVADDTTPVPVTGAGSSFTAATSTTAFGAVDLAWPGYNELAQGDVARYRVYVGNTFFDDVTGLTPFGYLPAGTQAATITGLPSGAVRHFAVVAEDTGGNFSPVVRSFSALTSISGVGEVTGLAGESFADSIRFTWLAPPDAAGFVESYHLYFGGNPVPVELPPTTTEWLATGLTPASGYAFRISTVDVFGNESGGVSLTGSTLLPNPANPRLTAVNGNVVLLWDPVSPAALVSYYEVYQSTVPFTDIRTAVIIATVPGTDAVVGTFASAQGLHFAVAAVNTLGGRDPAVISREATKQSQTITFPAPAVNGTAAIPLAAISSSGLAVSYAVTPAGSATLDLSGATPALIPVRGGRVTITASQEGNASFWPALPVSREVRLPPVITSFTANGVEIGTAALSDIDELLRVEAQDSDGISRAEFFIRPSGNGAFTSVGVDVIPGNGLSALLPLDVWADGTYDLRVTVQTPEGVTTTVSRSATLALGPPAAPVFATPAAGQRVDNAALLVSGTAARSSTVRLFNNGTPVAGPLPTGPAGEFSTTITLAPGDNPLTAQATNRSGSGPLSAARIVTLRSLLTVSVTPSILTEGQSGTVRVARNHSQGAASVRLSAGTAGQLTMPASLLIPDGASEASGAATAVDDDVAEVDDGLTITASAPSFLSGSTTVTILDNDRPGLVLSLNRSTISEGAPAGELLATLTRNPVTATPFTVRLGVSDSSAVRVPETTTIPAFTASITVPVEVVNDTVLDGDQTAVIFASIRDVSTGESLAESNDVSITVTDDDGPALFLTLARSSVQEGQSTLVTVKRNSGTGPLTATLTVDDTSEASISPQAVFAAGALETTATLTGLTDGQTDGNQTVLVRATAPGFAAAEAGIVVTDLALPDLVVTRLTTPATAFTDGSLNFTCRVENQGASPISGPVALRILLSRDVLPDAGDRVVETYVFPAGLPAGLYFEHSATAFTPGESGPWHLIAEVDPENSQAEILDTNNLRVSAPVDIRAAWQASVSTSVSVAPAGTDVPLSGTATNTADGTPAAFRLVSVHLAVRGTERVLSALTDSSGRFSLTFHPLPGEGGTYTAGAAHPGDSPAPVQDSFTLLGFSALPETIDATVTRDGPAAEGSLTLANLADVALHGLSLTPAGLTAGYTLTAQIRGGAVALGGLGNVTVDYSITASGSAPDTGSGALRVTSSEGAIIDIPVSLTARSPESRLAWDGERIERGMVPGTCTFVNVTVRNDGSAPTGPVAIVLPEAAWLSAASASPLPPLASGESADVTLQLCPAADLPLTAYNGAFQLRGDHNTLTIPFTFRAVSDQNGAVTVHCEDEYTYFAASTPPLAGARVTLCDALDGSTIVSAVSGADGAAAFPTVREGYYLLKVSAERHGEYRKTVFVSGGITNEFSAFLSRQTVEYVWNVVPTEIKDRYKIVVETTFETNVPAPVVTIDPPYVDLDALSGDVTQIDFTLTNHGLIAARQVRLNFGSSSRWEIQALASNLGDLPAKSALTVPVTFRKVATPGGRADADCSGPSGSIDWCYVCGDINVCGTASIGFSSGDGCYGPVYIPPGGPGSGGSYLFSPAPVHGGGIVSCDPCVLKALIDCAISFVPNPAFTCGYAAAGTAMTCHSEGGSINCTVDIIQTGVGCVCGFIPGYGTACNAVNCFIDIAQCIAAGAAGGQPGGRAGYTDIVATFEDRGRAVAAMVDFEVALYGDEAWRPLLEDPAISGFTRKYRTAIAGSTLPAWQITAEERSTLLADEFGARHATLVNQLADRWNRTLDYNNQGIFDVSGLAAGQNPDFFTLEGLHEVSVRITDAFDRVRADGYDDPVGAFGAALQDMFAFLSSGDGVCARVKLRLEQEAVLTRDAFAATLEINNRVDAPVESVAVNLRVLDSAGIDRTDRFGLTAPVVTGLSGGDVPGNASASWAWTLVPSQDAAPTEPTRYFVEGTLYYMQDGEMITIPLAREPITVYPGPSLRLKYFHQRDVFSDDPHTEEVEPSIPFTLGVMVENRGAGPAKNLTITSGQPEIVENEKGLLIDFQIIATEVAGLSLSPGLTADFGTIPPGAVKVGRWLMTSTLQGLFLDYHAEFEHLDDLGNERLSLIESVEIHETIHQIEALGALSDGLPDFLVNDIPDLLDRPDTVHLSDGSTAPVAVSADASAAAPTTGVPTVTLTAPGMGTGWTYLRIPDPGHGVFRLTGVQRSDGLTIPLDVNVWQTDRTFVGLGKRPIRENILHLIDRNSTGSYTLTYAPVLPPDTAPPTSAVTALPASSGSFISVSWVGSDNRAVAFYDVFVSENGGPFTPWLVGTTRTEGLYPGVSGSSYAFYSVARDAAGNAEAPKTTADSSTTVNRANQPPVLDAVTDRTVTEGNTLTLQLHATDPDGPAGLLRYSVTSPQPGIVVNPSTGRLTWSTGDEHGGLTVPVEVTVTDGDAAPLSAVRSFTITVTDTNAPPVLTISPPVAGVDAGDRLTATLTAADRDFPAQTIRYRIASGAPPGMTLNPVSGAVAWTPAEADATRSFEIRFEAFDDQTPAGVGSAVLRVNVRTRPGLPPVFLNPPSLQWTEAGTYAQAFRAADPEGDPVTVTAGASGLPGWVKAFTLPDGSAQLFWNTTGVAPGLYELSLTAATDRQTTSLTQPILVGARAAYSDFSGWAGAYGLAGANAQPAARLNPQQLPNLMCYALGIDPSGGVSPAQPEPTPAVDFSGGVPSFRFLAPSAGRTDLRYDVESAGTPAGPWTAIATRSGSSPWAGTAAASLTPARGDLSWVAVSPGPAGSGFLRLRVTNITASGFYAWEGGAGTGDPATSDTNGDGTPDLMAYALGAPAPSRLLAGSGIVLPEISLNPLSGDVVLRTTLAAAPRPDIRYALQASSDLITWTEIGWWETGASAEAVARFRFTPAGAEGREMAISWRRSDVGQPFVRLAASLK